MSDVNRQETDAPRRRRNSKVGVVVSDKPSKTVVVKVNRLMLHPRYHRVIRRSSKFMAHDEREISRAGDTVEIVESPPLSARKRWRVCRVLRQAVRFEEGAR